jgi:hypothetical protein
LIYAGLLQNMIEFWSRLELKRFLRFFTAQPSRLTAEIVAFFFIP